MNSGQSSHLLWTQYKTTAHDLIDSEDTEDAAMELALQVAEIHAAAGSYIRNWASNSTKVLSQLSQSSKITQAA